MLSTINPVATIGVKNLEAAKKFYEGTLGFKPLESSQECVQMYKCGDATVEVYESTFAGTNKATSLTFFAGDKLEKEVEELKSKGVKFEHYDNMDAKIVGDIHDMGDMKAAWFKDPDGNIINLVNH